MWPLDRLYVFMVALACLTGAVPALAAPCETGSFETWLETFKREAAAKGLSPRAINAAFEGVTYDPSVVSRDRRQGVFRQSFEQFAGRMISSDRMRVGAHRLKQYAGTFNRIEQQ